MSASPAVRSLRAAVFAAVCVLLAAAGHGLAMGAMPPLRADTAGFAAVFGLGWLLGGRERSLVGIGATMLAVQAGLHTAFGLARSAAPAAAHAMRMPTEHGHHTLTHVSDPHALTGHATAAHVLAALAASWWLRRGEAALWSLLRRAATLVPGLVAWWHRCPLPAAPDERRGAPASAVPHRRPLLRYAVRRRGPPARIPYAV
ncbi:hypothetical protein [Streptomyces sp. NPDC086787]|uniref:hypothetical protein n=1 Tax=Streptomyces sp. NPDC086787 TaxID=3365759 RepID=UPI0037FBED7B